MQPGICDTAIELASVLFTELRCIVMLLSLQPDAISEINLLTAHVLVPASLIKVNINGGCMAR